VGTQKISIDDLQRPSPAYARLDTSMDESANVQQARRRFIQAALLIPAAAFLPGCSLHAGEVAKQHDVVAFFNDSEHRFIEAATARLIPSDGDGMGAKEAAVSVFIDRQLAGAYGRADTWYMQGPWQKGIEQQGYQLKYSPAELYRIAIRNIDAYCQRSYGNKNFADLSPGDQDQVLHGLEHGDIELADVSSKTFFTVLWKNTQEGFLSDPMYGGNRNFVGWKLIGFPGPRYNYVEEITQYGKPYTLPTVGILGRDGTRTLEG
jgi:gluconate 2-dehydrogenase gamma chain